MPELPEVETVKAGLAPVMEGAVIARAEVNRPDLRWPFPAQMSERLTGKRVLALRRRSKYLLGDLDSGEALLIHLGMSGRMLVSGAQVGVFFHPHPAPVKHDHVVLDLEGVDLVASTLPAYTLHRHRTRERPQLLRWKQVGGSHPAIPGDRVEWMIGSHLERLCHTLEPQLHHLVAGPGVG